jgi:hypothetical protein
MAINSWTRGSRMNVIEGQRCNGKRTVLDRKRDLIRNDADVVTAIYSAPSGSVPATANMSLNTAESSSAASQ